MAARSRPLAIASRLRKAQARSARQRLRFSKLPNCQRAKRQIPTKAAQWAMRVLQKISARGSRAKDASRPRSKSGITPGIASRGYHPALHPPGAPGLHPALPAFEGSGSWECLRSSFSREEGRTLQTGNLRAARFFCRPEQNCSFQVRSFVAAVDHSISRGRWELDGVISSCRRAT